MSALPGRKQNLTGSEKMNVSLSYALKTWGLYCAAVVLCLFFVAGIENAVLLTVLNVLFLCGFLMLTYGEGAYNGEKACTLEVSLEKQLKEGRVIEDKLKKQVFSRKNGVVMLLICLAPFLLISVANLAVAPLYPAEEAAIEEEEAEREAFSYDYEAVDSGSATKINWVNVVARVVYMPYVFSYTLVSNTTLNYLFLLYAFPFPLAAFCGYMRGPATRQKKLKTIALGKKRKMRNLKVNGGNKPQVMSFCFIITF